MQTLPTDSQERKEYPLFDGALMYFPAAIAGLARHSKVSNDRHNPGEEMHHSRGKSADHGNCILRHLTDLGDMLARIKREPILDVPQINALLAEANALFWRAGALSQELHERFGGAPLAPAARKEAVADPSGVADSAPAINAAGGLVFQAGITYRIPRTIELGDDPAKLISSIDVAVERAQDTDEARALLKVAGWPAPRCTTCMNQVCTCNTVEEFF